MPEIVLVHGLWVRSWSLILLKRRLQKRGFSIRSFNYSTSRRDPAESSKELGEFCLATTSSGLHLAGHSLGGLLILQMLQQLEHSGQQLNPGRVVMLGSPISGSLVARRLASTAMGRTLLRHSETSLIDGIGSIPQDRQCGMIAGTHPRGLGRATGNLEGPNDGTVTVEETSSDRLTDHIELAVSHTGLLFSREVSRQLVRFLCEGCFDRP